MVHRRELRWLAVAVVLGGTVGVLVRVSGLHPVKVTSGSMSPAVKVGDWIAVRDLDHHDARRIARGDIVMFRFPLGTKGRAVKRVVALAGDRVAIAPGVSP